MKAGICSIQQALTVEAAAVVKQAVTLAKRRGHAQVTPLHVASSMLTSSTGLLRRACLSSHSHPLQCKALELCFNVALNRLPSSTPGPLLGLHSAPHHHHPALSNALVAAFKRAQAHQRRGSMENQQQPILALKIEVEQLIISILDDPSVSRVMREAGFSSPQVKSRVEQAVSVEICSPPPPQSKDLVIAAKPLSIVSMAPASNDDVSSLVEALMGKKRNVVVIGEGISSGEGVVRGVMDRFEKGTVPTELRSVQFISLPLFALRNLSREEVEAKMAEVRSLAKNCVGFGRGVVFYLGDLQGVSDFWSSYVEQRRGSYFYCSMEHIVMEMKKMVCGVAEIKRVWLMGVATFRTYMKCKSGYPSLESLWDLHPLTIPAGSLSLSLNLDSNLQDEDKSKILIVDSDKNLKNPTVGTSVVSSSLPSWLQQYKNETISKNNKEESGNGKNLKKWNSFCNRAQNDPQEKTLKFYSTPSSPTTSFSSPDRTTWPAIIEFKESSPKEHQFWVSKPDLLSNPNSSPNSASSSEVAEDMNDAHPTFNNFSPENLRTLTDALESKVPWQRDVILEISSTVLECRSGISKKPRNRQETWMFFLGSDSNGKEKISRELAKLVFGSQANFASIGVCRFSDRAEGLRNKRPRDDEFELHGGGYLQRFAEAVNENPHRVFVLEEFDQIGYSDQVGIKRAMEIGVVEVSSGEIVSLRDAIVVLSCESFGCVVKRAKRSGSRDEEDDDADVAKPSGSLDLNMAVEDEKEESDGVGILELVDKKVFLEVKEQ